jgi:hypothetical protein
MNVFFVFWILFEFPMYVRLFLIFFSFLIDFCWFELILIDFDWFELKISMDFYRLMWIEWISRVRKWVKNAVFSVGVKMLENVEKVGFGVPRGVPLFSVIFVDFVNSMDFIDSMGLLNFFWMNVCMNEWCDLIWFDLIWFWLINPD